MKLSFRREDFPGSCPYFARLKSPHAREMYPEESSTAFQLCPEIAAEGRHYYLQNGRMVIVRCQGGVGICFVMDTCKTGSNACPFIMRQVFKRPPYFRRKDRKTYE